MCRSVESILWRRHLGLTHINCSEGGAILAASATAYPAVMGSQLEPGELVVAYLAVVLVLPFDLLVLGNCLGAFLLVRRLRYGFSKFTLKPALHSRLRLHHAFADHGLAMQHGLSFFMEPFFSVLFWNADH